MTRLMPLILLGCTRIDPGPVPVQVAQQPVSLLVQQVDGAPNIYLAAMIAAGSAYDPLGREGIAYLTASGLVQAGAGSRSADEIRESLQPTGSAFEVLVEREWISLRLECHRDHARQCAELFADALVAPHFAEDDVLRLRDEQHSDLQEELPSDEEWLGLEAMEMALYEGHPYGHPVLGRAGVVPLLEAEDLRAFWRQHYVRRSIFVGVAGDLPEDLAGYLAQRLEQVPGAMPRELVLRDPPPPAHRTLLAIDTGSPSTGFYLAHPLALDRSHPDFPAMMVATTALGAHRESFGRLFRSLRAERGLNYGDYAYIEPYVERAGSQLPDQGVLRRQNRFVVWLRPTSVDNGPFALKLAVEEVERWVKEGLQPDEFSAILSHLQQGRPLLASDPGRRLTYALDAAATGTPNLLELPLEGLTREQVNEAIARHVDPTRLQIVAVSGEARALVEAVMGEAPTPQRKEDGSASDQDAQTASKALGLKPEHVWIVEADGLFR
jgi:zinc protease